MRAAELTRWRKDRADNVGETSQLNSSLLTNGGRMAKRNTVHKNKSNDQSKWD